MPGSKVKDYHTPDLIKKRSKILENLKKFIGEI